MSINRISSIMDIRRGMSEVCCCCGCGCEHRHYHKGFRRFLTKEEHIRELEEYIEELKKEINAVEAHLKELKS